jgi:N-acetylmuramoyl-L-alanine amidase
MAALLSGGSRTFADLQPAAEVRLTDLAAKIGLTLRAENDQRIVGENRYHRIIWETNNRRIFCDGTAVFLNSRAQKRGAAWLIGAADAYLISALLAPGCYLADKGYNVVVLDPGHGGEFDGAAGPDHVREKTLTLDIAKRVRDKLRESGVIVYLTRDRDRALNLDHNQDLVERCRRATRLQADLFVSIHMNSSADRSVSGLETYVAPATGYPATSQGDGIRFKPGHNRQPVNQFDGPSTILAYYLQKGLLSCAGGVDRGVKRANFVVLQYAPCPAALVECGFLSNRQEGAKLMTPSQRELIAEGIARGIRTYVSQTREARLSQIPIRPAPASATSSAPAARPRPLRVL